MLTIDLRGKTEEEVVALIKEHQLGSGEVADGTDLWQPGLDPKYVGVIIVWLKDEMAMRQDENKRDIPAKATFILWDGRKSQPKQSDDLHGFIYSDGSIDWGKTNTMNRMR